MRQIFTIRPLEHGLKTEYPSANADSMGAHWPSMNVRANMHRIKKRWDYSVDRTLATGATIQYVSLYKKYDATTFLMILTDTDLVSHETSGTFSYKTDTYTTGTIASITGTAVVGSTTDWGTAAIAAGDKFIVTADHSATSEDDVNWATVSSVADGTHLTLTGNYSGATTTGAYKIRRVYSIPTDERWQFATVSDKFCFTNGNVNVQAWTGTGYASDLNATYAKNARYCLTYADRLFLADLDVSGSRNPWTLRWSKQGDATDWTDATAGEIEFIDTEDPITGIGQVGNGLFVYKKKSIIMGYRTGDPNDPVTFPNTRKGIGLWAPYSLVHAMGTNAFLGEDDFYMINGDRAEAIGGDIRPEFFRVVAKAQREKVIGFHNPHYDEILWLANTSDGQIAFVFNWKDGTWQTYDFSSTVTGFGE